MASDTRYFTQDGYSKLLKELDHLKKVKRREISLAIGEAREQGDLKENAEYDAAKEAQGMNEMRIAELEHTLSRARIIDYEDLPKDEIRIGATTKLRDAATKEEIVYTLVAKEEADFASGKISVESPVGQGLLGHKVKETVTINVPAGTLTYLVLEITRHGDGEKKS